MPLDLAVSQAILRIRALERALHDPGPWFIVLHSDRGTLQVLANRQVNDDNVTFTIPVLPGMSGGREIPFMTLRCDRDDVLTKNVNASIFDDPCELDWAIGLDSVAA